jgi:hypothetical protein
MKSLDRNSLEEQTRLVSRYVAGDLSRSERAEFEAWLIASPELAAEVEMERRLRRGMASAARRGWLNHPLPQQHAAPSRRWQMAIAASALLSMGLAVMLALPDRDAQGDSSRIASTSSSTPKRVASPLSVRLSKLRGVGEAADVRFSLADLPSQLTLEPEVVVLTCEDGTVELECAGGGTPQTSQYPEYELEVLNRGGTSPVWRSERQQPASSTQLSFTMRDPSTLVAGDYEIVVRGVSPDHEEVVGRFSMKVSR